MPPVLSMGGGRSAWLSVHCEPVSEWELSARTSCQEKKKENYPHLYEFLRSDRCWPLLCYALCDYLREERKCLVPTCTDSCQSFTKSGCIQPQHENSISQDTQGTPQKFPPLGTSEHSGQGVHVCVLLVITARSEFPKLANRQHSLQNARTLQCCAFSLVLS